MEINITCFLQIFNFFVAYIILKFLLFKPAIKAINEQKIEEKSLDHALALGKQKINEAYDTKKALWLSCKMYLQDKNFLKFFKKNNQAINTDIMLQLDNDVSLYKDSIEKVKKLIVKKVSNVNNK